MAEEDFPFKTKFRQYTHVCDCYIMERLYIEARKYVLQQESNNPLLNFAHSYLYVNGFTNEDFGIHFEKRFYNTAEKYLKPKLHSKEKLVEAVTPAYNIAIKGGIIYPVIGMILSYPMSYKARRMKKENKIMLEKKEQMQTFLDEHKEELLFDGFAKRSEILIPDIKALLKGY
jgi:hypothetical protein